MASACYLFRWLECLRTESLIVNDNAINHGGHIIITRLLQPAANTTNVYAVDNTIPTLRPYSSFRLKRIKQRSSNVDNNNNDNDDQHIHQEHPCHQKHYHQQNNNDNHNNHHDVAPQMPKRLLSHDSLIHFEFTDTNHNNLNDNNNNIYQDNNVNYQNKDEPIHYSSSSSNNAIQVIHYMNEMTAASYRCCVR